MTRHLVIAVLASCSAEPVAVPEPRPAPVGPIVDDRAAVIDGAMLALQAIERAQSSKDLAVLATLFADDYAQLGCGVLQRFATPMEAATSLVRISNLDWRITVSRDRKVGWAIGTFGDRVVLEERAGRWLLVAHARGMFCPQFPEAPPRAGTAIRAEVSAAPQVTVCAIEHVHPTAQWSLERMLAVDADRDGRPDLGQLDLANAQILQSGTVAWLTGPAGPGARPFAIAELVADRWEIVELMWNGPYELFETICTEDVEQRALINWRIARRAKTADEKDQLRMRGTISFAHGEATLDDGLRAELDGVAAKIKLAPDGFVDLYGSAATDEPHPMGLAERRALVVASYLRDRGVPAARQLVRFSDAAPDPLLLGQPDNPRSVVLQASFTPD